MWEDTIENQSKKVYHKKFPFSTFLLWKEDCPNQEPLFNTFQRSILMCQHQFCWIETKVGLIKSCGKLFIWNSCYHHFDGCFWQNRFIKNSISFSLKSLTQNRWHKPPYFFYKEITFLKEQFHQKNPSNWWYVVL